MTAYPGCAGLARLPFVLTEHISSYSTYSIITASGTQQVNFMEKFCVKAGISCRFILLASEASETLSGVTQSRFRYIYLFIYLYGT